MGVVESIVSLWITISNWFWSLIRTIVDIFSWIINFIHNLLDIISTIFFWLWSLLSWLWDLIIKVFDWSVFLNVSRVFWILTSYIWTPAVIFMSTLLLIIILRIFIAFIFKILRLNIDYSNTYNNTRTISQHKNLK